MIRDLINGNMGLLSDLGTGSQQIFGGLDGAILGIPAWALGVIAVIAGAAAIATGATAGTASAVANNPFIQHDMGTASADAGNVIQDQLANAADSINDLQIPGLFIPVQRP